MLYSVNEVQCIIMYIVDNRLSRHIVSVSTKVPQFWSKYCKIWHLADGNDGNWKIHEVSIHFSWICGLLNSFIFKTRYFDTLHTYLQILLPKLSDWTFCFRDLDKLSAKTLKIRKVKKRSFSCNRILVTQKRSIA